MDTKDPSTPQVAPQYIDLPDDPPAWPKVIGIISIVFASLGLGCMGCAGAGLVMQVMFAEQSAEQMGGPMPDVLKPGIVQLASIPIGGVISLILLIAGILLLRRKPAGRTMHLVYAVLNLISTAVSTIAGVQQLGALKAWIAANPDSKWAQVTKPEMQGMIMIVSVAVFCSYPLFLLVWFGLVKRRASDMGKLPEYL